MKKFFDENAGFVFFSMVVLFVVSLIGVFIYLAHPKPKVKASSLENYISENIKHLETDKRLYQGYLKKDTSRERAKIKAFLADQLTYEVFLKNAKDAESKAYLKKKIEEMKKYVEVYQNKIYKSKYAKRVRDIDKKLKSFKKMNKNQKEEK